MSQKFSGLLSPRERTMSLRLTPELTVGFDDIDADHRAMFQRLEALVAAAQTDDAAGARSAMATLGDCLLAHFAAEESLMNAARFPERGRHKSAHDLFMQDFVQLGRDLAACGLSVPVVQWITMRLPEWVKFHIQVNDVPLGRFLASNRVSRGGTARADKPRVA
jgi:hemerythrin